MIASSDDGDDDDDDDDEEGQHTKPLLTAKAVSDGLHRADDLAQMSVDVVPIT
jgi:hypothetical protein